MLYSYRSSKITVMVTKQVHYGRLLNLSPELGVRVAAWWRLINVSIETLHFACLFDGLVALIASGIAHG